MPELSEVDEKLLRPPRAPTDIRASEQLPSGDITLVEMSESPEAWIRIDGQHVYSLTVVE